MNWFSILVNVLTAMLPTLKKITDATENLLDDIGYLVAKLFLTDPELQAAIKAWLEGKFGDTDRRLFAVVGTDKLRAELMADSKLMSIVHQVAGRLNIPWEKVFEWIMKILPILLPIFLAPKPEA